MGRDWRRLADLTCPVFHTETSGLFQIMHGLVEAGAVRFRPNGRKRAAPPPSGRLERGISGCLARFYSRQSLGMPTARPSGSSIKARPFTSRAT